MSSIFKKMGLRLREGSQDATVSLGRAMTCICTGRLQRGEDPSPSPGSRFLCHLQPQSLAPSSPRTLAGGGFAEVEERLGSSWGGLVDGLLSGSRFSHLQNGTRNRATSEGYWVGQMRLCA